MVIFNLNTTILSLLYEPRAVPHEVYRIFHCNTEKVRNGYEMDTKSAEEILNIFIETQK